MYQPPPFREERLEVLHALIRAHPFATLVALEDGALSANHMPFVLHPELGPQGTLRGHVARANPVWRALDPALGALAIFQGANGYISPAWYPSKAAHGKVVPTWNYAVVHVHAAPRIVEDAAWLRAHLDSLVAQQEGARPLPWAVSDAPEDFVARQLEGIVGLELPIARIAGKWKVSQNRNAADREGVSRGLRREAGETASVMAELVERYGGAG